MKERLYKEYVKELLYKEYVKERLYKEYVKAGANPAFGQGGGCHMSCRRRHGLSVGVTTKYVFSS